MDINAFAVELAKVTMVIARKLAIDELHINEHPLPLDNLDRNFVAGDALMNEKRSAVGWPKVDVIIGNPPFLGAKRLKPERGAEYVNALRGVYPAITGMSDYCVYWFRKAHDHLPSCSVEDPVAGLLEIGNRCDQEKERCRSAQCDAKKMAIADPIRAGQNPSLVQSLGTLV